MKDKKELAVEIVNNFSNLPFPTSPNQAKFFSKILADSHIYAIENNPFESVNVLNDNNEYWKGVKREIDRMP